MTADVGTNDEQSSISLRDVTAALWHRRWLILAIVIVGTATRAAMSLTAPDVYQARASLLLRPTSAQLLGTASSRSDPVRALNDEAGLMVTQQVKNAVREDLGAATDLSTVRANAVFPDGSDFLSLSATNEDPEEAARIVNGYAQSYIDWRREQQVSSLLAIGTQLQERVDELNVELALVRAPLDALEDELIDAGPGESAQLEREREALIARLSPEITPLLSQLSYYEQQLDQLQVSARLADAGGVELVSAATIPRGRLSPQPLEEILLALVLSAVIGVTLALALEQFDDRIRDVEDLDKAVPGLPVLGHTPSISTKEPLVDVIGRGGVVAESFRSLRTSVRFTGIDRDLNLIQVTSAMPAEGKTTVTAGLGIVMAQLSERVLLVDCDLRRPRLHSVLGLDNEVGLSNLLAGEGTLADALQRVPGIPSLYLLASGPLPPNPSELLASNRTRELMSVISDACDVALLDSPPVLSVTDSMIVSRAASATIMVTRRKRSTRRQLAKATTRITDADAALIGAVLNDDDAKAGDGDLYRYGYTG